jgi:D-arabinose 1-dehydrogenase-like Zn-dependent alcohol dehydrogenase
MQEYPLEPAGVGRILVRTTMSTICRSDIHSWQGSRHNPSPSILGHEIIGEIEEIGDTIGPDLLGQALRAGDRVTWTEYFYCGEYYYCAVLDTPQKCVNIRKYGHERSDAAESAAQCRTGGVFGSPADGRSRRLLADPGSSRHGRHR